MSETQASAKRNKPEVVEIQMEDGRLVEFAGKREMLKSSAEVDGKVQVRLDFRNGQTRLFTIPDTLTAKFAAHGAEQKLGDEVAGLKGENGTPADLEDKILAVDELIDRLYNGEWNVKREANGLAGTSILLRALVELSGKSREDMAAFLKTKTHQEKIALRNSAKVKPIIDRLESEKAKANVDTDALLAGIGIGI